MTVAGRVLELSKPVICIVGPTASGKSELAQCVAERVDGEVVSADSMQVYHGMDIGTGKVLPADRRVPHHGFDLVEPGEPFSAALFQSYARTCFSEIDARGKQSVLCGGTGFYVRAAIDCYEFPAGEQVDNPIRERYAAYERENGAHALWELLAQRDRESAEIISENDVKRVIRAFELLEDGTSYARQKEALAHIEAYVDTVMIGLSVDPEVLVERIDKRVDRMFEEGLVEEVRSLLNKGLRSGITSPQAIGYKEIVSAIDGEISFDEAKEAIKVATRRYAKRQRTWFRKDKRIWWIDANVLDMDAMTESALDFVSSAESDREVS